MIVFTVMLSSFSFYFWQVFYTPNILIEKPDQTFFIEREDDFKDVQNKLYDLGIVNDLVTFSFLAKLKSYDDLVKPGMYLLKSDMSNRDAINLLRSGAQTPIKMTFSQARKVQELPGIFSRFMEFDSLEMAELMFNDTTANYYGFDSLSYISMFIPNTYEIYWTTSPAKFLDRMKTEYDRFWNADRKQLAMEIGLTPTEVSTLASSVQAEISKYDEARKVAGLYVNRLKSGTPLQADPTVVFAVGDFTIRRVLNRHIAVDSPFNTYKNRGLPPGPINLPGINILEAVLDYERHDYLFMCAKEDFSGYHAFAETLEEHDANARRLHRALNREGIYR